RPDLRTVPDVRPGCGSLGGIYTAVVSGCGPVLCVAWDMPFVTPELLQALRDGAAGCDAFLPESGSRRGVEPLCAVYGPACGPAIERQLTGGDLQAIGFHRSVKVGTLSRERVLFERTPQESDPVTLARRYLDGADIVVVEGFKRAPLPKIEVYRLVAGPDPIFDSKAHDPGDWVAMVTDHPRYRAEFPVFRFSDTAWLVTLANLAWDRAKILAP